MKRVSTTSIASPPTGMGAVGKAWEPRELFTPIREKAARSDLDVDIAKQT